jgi:hypothetical protein
VASSQPLLPSSGTPPWQEKQLAYGLKLLLTFGAGLLSVVVLVSGITFLIIVPQMIIKGPGPRDTIESMITLGLVLGGVLGVSLFGLIKLYPYVSAPTSFQPAYGAVPAEAAGHVFEAKYRRRGWGRSLSGKGAVRFDQALHIEGYLTPSPLFQSGIILLVTIIPLVVLGIGLGFIPALIIAYYAGRKQISQAIPYTDMRELMVKGCRVSFRRPGGLPGNIAFYIAASDGERLYHELQEHFPAMFVNTMG